MNLLDSHIKAANDEGEPPSAADSMTTLSDAIILFADAMHAMDLRRRAAFRHEVRDEYKSLCNHTQPVERFLFGKELLNFDKRVIYPAVISMMCIYKVQLRKSVTPISL